MSILKWLHAINPRRIDPNVLGLVHTMCGENPHTEPSHCV
jgi:hypothetical protein